MQLTINYLRDVDSFGRGGPTPLKCQLSRLRNPLKRSVAAHNFTIGFYPTVSDVIPTESTPATEYRLRYRVLSHCPDKFYTFTARRAGPRDPKLDNFVSRVIVLSALMTRDLCRHSVLERLQQLPDRIQQRLQQLPVRKRRLR